MRCHESGALQLFADDELDAAACAAFVAHRDQCPHCTRESAALRALRTRVQTEVPYHAMPARLRQRLDAAVADHGAIERARIASHRATRGSRWLWAGSGALAGSAFTVAAAMLVMAASAWMSNRGLVDQVAAAHGRSSVTGHVVDIASSDHHTVKPWLSQRLDYSPPVVDLEDQGFPLLGGRLDRLDDASVATLIYRAGQHRVDVFVRPLPTGGNNFAATSVRGYNLVEARGRGMEWIGVSDVNPAQLQRLVDLLAHPAPHAESAEPPFTRGPS